MRPPEPDGRLRVLHVINTLRDGGAEMNLVRLALNTDRDVVEPHIAFCGTWPLEHSLNSSGIRTVRLEPVLRRVRSRFTPRIIARLVSYIRKHRIDLVHTHLLNAHVWGAVATRLTRARLVEHVHDHRYTDRRALAPLGPDVTRQYNRAVYFSRLSDHVVVLTRQHREFVLEHSHLPASRVSIIPNGLPQRPVAPDASERAELRQSLGIPPAAPMVLAVGRLASEKNFGTLIAAVECIRSRVPALRVFILGEGPERPALQQQIDAKGLSNIIQLPGHSRSVQKYYDAADVFVQPSTFELQSLAMLEAMQAGLPVIVSSGIGSNDELISDGETGFLVHPGRTADWAMRMVGVLEDSGLRAKVGAGARQLVQANCGIRQIAARFERLYVELCGS